MPVARICWSTGLQIIRFATLKGAVIHACTVAAVEVHKEPEPLITKHGGKP